MTRPIRILVPTDFSERSERALEYAAIVSEGRAEIILLHVFDTRRHNLGLPPSDVERLEAVARQMGNELLRRCWQNDRDGKLVFEALVRWGIPSDEILRLAEERGIDLIVIGTHGRRGIRRAVFGSVAEEVVRAAPCPVLAVKVERKTAGRRDRDAIAPC